MTTVHILFDFVEGPWGGGNQFLKALRDYLRENDVYADDPADADAVLVNSHHNLREAVDVKHRSPDTVVVQRIDGPVYDIRGRDKLADEIIYDFNRRFADGTVFQSDWSRQRNRYHGLAEAPFETTVLNAPDPDIFNRENASAPDGEPVKLIATSWSDNMRKGFDIYRYLDRNLDFDRFEFTFVGNSPIEYENVNWVDPVPPEEIADYLKSHDVYVTASRNDPCSNALIEALHCGLPAVARDDGGHPEIVGDAGELFTGEDDVIPAIEAVASDVESYRENIDVPTMDESGEQYYQFIRSIVEQARDGAYEPKRVDARERAAYRATLAYQMTKRRVLNTVFG